MQGPQYGTAPLIMSRSQASSMALRSRHSSEEQLVATAGWSQLEHLLHLQMLAPAALPCPGTCLLHHTSPRVGPKPERKAATCCATLAHWHLLVPIIKDVPHACFCISVSHCQRYNILFPAAAELRLQAVSIVLLLMLAPWDMKAMVRQTVCLDQDDHGCHLVGAVEALWKSISYLVEGITWQGMHHELCIMRALQA